MTRFTTYFVSGLFLFAAIVLLFCPSLRADDIATVRDRYVRTDLPTNPAEIQQIHDTAAEYVKTLRPDGSWADVEYTSPARSAWPAAQHLVRLIVLAKSARLDRDAGHPDAKLDSQVQASLKFWLDHDFQNPNWWWNQIGVPRALGEVGCLTLAEIPQPQMAMISKIMQRPVDWRKWTGANLTWGAAIQIMRGCLEQSSPTIAEGYTRMYQEIRITKQPEEGIQADWSFHQHGRQLYNGGYGLPFANDVGRYISLAWGTAFQIPPEPMQVYSSYILDGQRWMVYRDIFDYSTVGREITRVTKLGPLTNWSVGSITPPGPAYSLWNTCMFLAPLDTPRKQDFLQFISQLENDGHAPPVSGNRQFWCSDYMVQRRGDFCTSVKMLSSRMRNAENVNNEGRESHFLSDGANFIYVDGMEYNNIFAVWDWNKIPGTTAEVFGDLPKEDPKGIGLIGGSDFVGGVSDGVNGLCAMQLVRGTLTAKKCWFFFDHIYACKGSEITSTSDRDVITSINQCHLVGDVMCEYDPVPVEHDRHYLDPGRWVYHDHVGYVFPQDQKLGFFNGDQSGRWSDFGTGSDALVTLPVFNLWIDHGVGCKEATYDYFVLPGTTVSETAKWAKSPDIKELGSIPPNPGMFDQKSKTAEIAFWMPFYSNSPFGQISVDQPCLLMVHDDGHGLVITASNPKNQPLDLKVKVGDKAIKFSLPGGLQAGSSVTQRLPD